jgi:hypothetical protein
VWRGYYLESLRKKENDAVRDVRSWCRLPIENSSDEVRLEQVREMRLRPRAERNACSNLARSNGKKAIEGGTTKKTVASIPSGCDEIEEIVRDCLMGALRA